MLNFKAGSKPIMTKKAQKTQRNTDYMQLRWHKHI